jgi:4-hydroxybenzoate polyprenyltransferase
MMALLCLVPSLATREGVRLGLPYWGGLVAVAALLLYEHAIVKPGDLSRVDAAFFTLNGAVSLLLMAAGVVDVFV